VLRVKALAPLGEMIRVEVLTESRKRKRNETPNVRFPNDFRLNESGIQAIC
jgi:hypothetical protein